MDISLVLLDDNPDDGIIFSRLAQKVYDRPDAAGGLKIRTLLKPPKKFSKLLDFDGIILDENLGAWSGMDIAVELKKENWRVPIMILTGMPMSSERLANYYAHVDYLAPKQDESVYLQTLSAFIRQIARIHEAAETGKTK